ncbi:MAG TPA: TonB-dependent receptor [Chitinophagales bacterium]|nr:TonB-dependent receptor [Chitinophagales bacterium]
MKKLLFFLLWANVCMAQTDSVSVKTDTLSTTGNTGKKNAWTINKEDVIISSTRAGNNSPTVFQTLSKEDINKNNLGQDLPFLLDNTPSVVTTSDAGAGIGYTGIRIRGSDATRVNVTLNGIPVNDAESQNTFWVDVPDIASSAQSIQIQRGVGTSTNGAGAFGGTISLQTQSPSAKPFVEANVSGGSFSTFRTNGKAGTGIRKGFFFEGSASWITSEGYIDRASSNLVSWFTQLGYMRNNTLIKLVYFAGQEKTYQAWNGVPQDSLKTNRTFNDLGTDYGAQQPPYKNQVDNYNQDYFQLLFAHYFKQGLSLNAGLFATLGHGYYEEYKAAEDLNAYFPGRDSIGIITDLVRQKWLQNVHYGGTWSLTYEQDKLSAVFGGAFAQFNGKHFGKVIWTEEPTGVDKDQHFYDGKVIKNDFNVYGKFNYELLEKVNFFVDLQYRYVHHRTNGVDDDQWAYNVNRQWHFFNPKAGILYKVKPQHHVYASYALGNREPNRDDILTAEASNKTVKPETLHDIEAGYKFLHSRFPLALNVYAMLYKDQLVLTGKLNDVGNPIKENVASSYRVGVELNGSMNFYTSNAKKYKGTIVDNLQYDAMVKSGMIEKRKVFAINYSFTYSVNKIKSFDEYVYTYDENYAPVTDLTQVITHKNSDISFSPNIIASLELVGYPVKGLEISLINKAVSKQYLDNTSNENRMLKPFFYSNLRLSYKLPLNRNDKEIKLTLLFNNIFNRLYESNGYTFSERYAYLDENNQQQVTPTATYNYYYPQAGFNMLGGISVRF